jgi:hypothetical protein
MAKISHNIDFPVAGRGKRPAGAKIAYKPIMREIRPLAEIAILTCLIAVVDDGEVLPGGTGAMV